MMTWEVEPKIGAPVWVREGAARWRTTAPRTIHTITNCTKTQITTQDARGDYYRFMRLTGNEVTTSIFKHWLEGLATETEFAEWNSTEGARLRDLAVKKTTLEARLKVLKDIESSFPQSLKPRLCFMNSETDLCKLELHNLTEVQVQRIVQALMA